MSRKASVERREMDEFARFWESLYQVVPEARRKAAEAMGEEVQKDLNIQIQSADLEQSAKGTVQSWQELRLGSKGGYAALSAIKACPYRVGKKPKSWNGTAVTVRQITKWLEKGHGVGHRTSTNPKGSRVARGLREGNSRWNDRTGVNYVYGRMFYSWTKMKAWEHAKKAAHRVLNMIADEVDY